MAAILASRRVLITPINSTRTIATNLPLRTLSTTASRKAADDDNSDKGPSIPFTRMPSPPRLPKEEQKVFEDLQKQSTGAFSTPRSPPKVKQSPYSESESESEDVSFEARVEESANASSGDKEQRHRDFWGGAKPEFEGEKNPQTGEVGGPKNEPLRWGAKGDWSYGGRVTDF